MGTNSFGLTHLLLRDFSEFNHISRNDYGQPNATQFVTRTCVGRLSTFTFFLAGTKLGPNQLGSLILIIMGTIQERGINNSCHSYINLRPVWIRSEFGTCPFFCCHNTIKKNYSVHNHKYN